MKIVVAIKQVPDSAAKVAVEGGQVTWGDEPLVMNPWDEYAVEAALTQGEALGEIGSKIYHPLMVCKEA